MVDIVNAVGIQASPERVYDALTTIEGLSGWWTDDVRGRGNAGDTLDFRFGDTGSIQMKVLEAEPGKHVLWQVLDGPQAWIGTRISWRLERDDDYTTVLFAHQGWKETTHAMHHCSTKWAVFLLSLKALQETGRGAPFPHDTRIGRTD